MIGGFRSPSFSCGRYWSRGRVPGTIVALLGGHHSAALLNLPIETIGSKFGGIPTGLPTFHIPAFRADLIMPLLPSAMTVALLAAIESLLSAVVADGMSGDRHNPTSELMAQGVANLVVPVCSAASRPPARSRAPPPTSVPAPRRRSPASSTR